MHLRPFVPTAAAILAATFVTNPVAAASVTDVSVFGSVSANANGSLFFEDLDQPAIGVSDSDAAEAASFSDFPLMVSAEARVTRPGGSTFLSGRGSASLAVDRSDDGVTGRGEISGLGGFGSSGGESEAGSGGGEIGLVYEFEVDSEAGYTLLIDLDGGNFVAPFDGSSSVQLTLRDETLNRQVAVVDGTGPGIDSRAVEELTGTLGIGRYSLQLEAFADIGEFSFDDGFAFSLTFDDLEGPAAVPSPAALPAGLALLGGLLTRRRR